MQSLNLSVREEHPVLAGDPGAVATLTVATSGTCRGDASMTGAFRGRIRTLNGPARKAPHHLSIASSAAETVSFTR